MEKLTTPEIRDFDASLPGENWFLYWKTSSSLWESKLSEYQGVTPLFVPIFWSLHSDYQDHFDFGQRHPETDLKRLVQIAEGLGLKIVFLIPTSPAPFLTNGGIPAYLARNLSENQERVAISAIDCNDTIHKVYSFYNPKIFQAYRKFVYHLSQYFSQSGIQQPVLGMECSRLEGGHIVSYFKDYSKSFLDGFSRYLSQIQDSEPQKIERLKSEPSYAKELKHEYSLLISSLYEEAARDSLAGNYKGRLKVSFVGGASEDMFRRSFDQWEQESDYFHPLMKSIVYGYYPCSILLGKKMKNKALGKAFRDTISTHFVRSFLDTEYYSDDSSLEYTPLVFFELSDGGEGHFSFERAMEQSGLAHFFKTEYPWSYHVRENFSFDFDDLEDRKVYFFFGERINLEGMSDVLKLFMNGQKVFLDMSDISPKVEQKMHYFFNENDIRLERINYVSPVLKASLGDGLIITYDRSMLKQTSLIKRRGFWDSMINYLSISHMEVDADSDVHYFWLKRSANSFELNYEEIRRVMVYNPTSYKKKMRLKSTPGFAFNRSIDEKFVEIKSTPIGIEILLMPGGSATLDFGYFEV